MKSLAATWAAMALAGAMAPGALWADETPFSYLYTTDSLPRGRWEYEQWNTVRTGKAEGAYTAFNIDAEVEHGFTDRFQGSFYLHSSYLHARGVPDPDHAGTLLRDQNNFDLNGVSVELKYQCLNPYKDPLGLSLYVEPELSVRDPLTGEDVIERSAEFRLILQKNLFDDRFVLASNILFEPEWEREDGERDKELESEFNVGASYRFAARWAAGLEMSNRRHFDRQSFGQQTASAFFLGPALHYGAQGWWATLTIFPQIAGNPHFLGFDTNHRPVEDSYRTLAEYEKMEVRLKVALEF